MSKSRARSQVEAKVAKMGATELRLMAEIAQDELMTRRNIWVNDMDQRFSCKENIGMACTMHMYDPESEWNADRVVVTCFKSKSRAEASVGVARLSPQDCFDYRIGVAIAFARAVGEPVPDLF